MMDELALIAVAQKGDLRAFNQLVLLYQGMAYNVAYRILNDADAAADATQDSFLSAYKAMKKFRGGSFKAWLLRIVTNACYDQLRVKKRRPTSSLDDLPVETEHSHFLRDEAESPDERLERLRVWLEKGPPGAYVRHLQAHFAPKAQKWVLVVRAA